MNKTIDTMVPDDASVYFYCAMACTCMGLSKKKKKFNLQLLPIFALFFVIFFAHCGSRTWDLVPTLSYLRASKLLIKWDGLRKYAWDSSCSTLGVQVRNMKMVFNIYGTWCWVTFEKLMMKIYDFFIRLSRLVSPYNIV